MDPGKGQNCTKDRLACAVHLFSVLKNQACCRKQGRIEIRGSDESLSIDLHKTFWGYYYVTQVQSLKVHGSRLTDENCTVLRY